MLQIRNLYLYWLGIYGYLHYGIGGKWGKINYKKSNYAHTAHSFILFNKLIQLNKPKERK